MRRRRVLRVRRPGQRRDLRWRGGPADPSPRCDSLRNDGPFNRNDCDANGSYSDLADDTDCDNDGINDVALVATSLAEAVGERIIANQTAGGMYFAELPVSVNVNVPGVLHVQDAGPAGTEVTVRYEDRWDGTPAGSRCRNSPDPALEGFVTAGADVVTVAGNVTVISSRLVEINGDLDGFPDTNETFDLYVSVANKTTTPLTNVVVQIASSDPKIHCILRSSSVIPALDARGGTNAIREDSASRSDCTSRPPRTGAARSPPQPASPASARTARALASQCRNCPRGPFPTTRRVSM